VAVPTRRRSSRASWAAGSTATAASEGSRGAAAASEPQQAVAATEPLRAATAAETQQVATVAEPRQPSTAAGPQRAATVMTATTTVAVAAPSTLPVPAAAGSPRAAVVEVPDDDVPPPGWDQWASLPASAPEPPTGALVVRGDDGAVLWGPTDGAGASSSHAALPTSGGPAARPEQEREHAGAPPAHFAEAQAEQGLWKELCDHGASLNRALNEALRIHSGPAWRVFQVSWISSHLAVPPPALFCVRAFPDSFSSHLALWRQDLEHRAWERYDALDRLDADLHWYRG
jgi:hypothetical protein